MMHLNDYQTQAETTAIYPGRGTLLGLTYCLLELSGEAGECAEKLGKLYRDSKVNPKDSPLGIPAFREALAAELGDVLWYVAAAAGELELSLDTIALLNLDKLASRAGRGKLGGSGDNR